MRRLCFITILCLSPSALTSSASASTYSKAIRIQCELEATTAALASSPSTLLWGVGMPVGAGVYRSCIQVAKENIGIYLQILQEIDSTVQNQKLWHLTRVKLTRKILLDLNRRMNHQLGFMGEFAKSLLAPDLTHALKEAYAAVAPGNYDYARLLKMTKAAENELHSLNVDL